jgi:hypothetical protein
MVIPSPVYIYRIVHRDNLQIFIDEGRLLSPKNATNPRYTSIGETELIRQRGTKEVTIEPYGEIRDYISFYFGTRSPMLYCIHNGYDVEKRPQSEIIYLVSSIDRVESIGCKYIFTDGHSFAEYSQPFNDRADLDKIDWNAVRLRRWNNTPDDPDRKRRKEAECLVYQEMPFAGIISIGVYNKEAFDYITKVMSDNNVSIPIRIIPEWYY